MILQKLIKYAKIGERCNKNLQYISSKSYITIFKQCKINTLRNCEIYANVVYNKQLISINRQIIDNKNKAQFSTNNDTIKNTQRQEKPRKNTINGIVSLVQYIRGMFRSAMQYNPPTSDNENTKEIEPIPKKYRYLILLSTIQIISGLCSLALEIDPQDLPHIDKDEYMDSYVGTIKLFWYNMQRNWVQLIHFLNKQYIQKRDDNTFYTPKELYTEIHEYFSIKENRNINSIIKKLNNKIIDTYDKMRFTIDLLLSLNASISDLTYSLEYGPMVKRPKPSLYVVALSYPDLGKEHDDGFQLKRVDAYFVGRLPGLYHEYMWNMYNHYLERDVMIGRDVMSFEDFINPDHKFIYDPKVYENGYPFDQLFLVTPKITMTERTMAQQLQRARDEKRMFESVTFVNGVAKLV